MGNNQQVQKTKSICFKFFAVEVLVLFLHIISTNITCSSALSKSSGFSYTIEMNVARCYLRFMQMFTLGETDILSAWKSLLN